MQPLRHTENQPEYGGLVIQPLRVRHDFQRKIPEDDWLQCHAEHEVIFKEMEKHDLKSREKYDPFDDLDFPRECVRPQWTYALRQSCNNFHDLTYDFTSTLWSSTDRFYRAQYLGSGLFRDAFLFTPTDTHNTPFVIKNKVYERELDQSDMHKINTEALVMEILSAPTLTTNIYGHCGSSILVEPGREIEDQIIPGTPHPGGNLGRISQAELDKLQQGDVHPMNNLTVEQKLDIAIAMAESLAELHGFKDGVMTNDDIDLGQWMYAADGRVILNDFNNAMLMEWGNKVKRYCQYWRKFNGFFKSPEEYDGSFLDESVDIWPMGNIVFSLLTGLYPYYDLNDHYEVRAATKKGPPHIDPRYKNRSFIEGSLVEIMNRCHKLNPSDRVSIFEVVRHLRETRELHQKNEEGR